MAKGMRVRRKKGTIGFIVLFYILIMPVLSRGILFATRPVEAAEITSELMVTVMSQYRIKLEWKDLVTGEKGFRIERAVNSGEFDRLVNIGPNTTYYIDTNVSPGNVYTYRVMLVRNDGTVTAYTDEVTVSSSMVISPNTLNLTTISDIEVEISWTYPYENRFDIVIERKEDVKGNWAVIARIPAGINAYTDTGLKPGTRYFYRIKAVTASNIFSAYYPNDYGKQVSTTLKAPYNLQGYAVTNNQIYISWEYDGEATVFHIERKIGNGEYSRVGIVTAKNFAWFYDNGLSTGVYYTYRVKAVKESIESNYSEEITINCTYLNPPVALSASAVSNSYVELLWDTAGINVGTKVEIWRKAGSARGWELYDVIEGRIGKYIDKNVDESSYYYYKLRSTLPYNNVYSNFSNMVSAGVYPYEAVDSLEYTVINEKSVQLKWNDNTNDESGFVIQKRTNDGSGWSDIASLPPNTRSYRVDELSPNEVYFFRIKVFRISGGVTSFSNEIKVVTSVPPVPSNVEVKSLSSRRIQLSWSPGSSGISSAKGGSEEGYIIERKEGDQGSFKVIAQLSSDENTYIDTGLLPYRKYIYRIKAYNKAGSSSYTVEKYAVTRRRVFFKDLDPFHPAREAIEELAERGIIKGKTEEYFAPNELITRAEFTGFIVNAFELKGNSKGSFADVTYGHEFYNEIMIAKNLGIIEGGRDNYFHPEDTLTRSEMAVIVDRVLKVVNKPMPENITDIINTYVDKNDIPSYARPVFAYFVMEKIYGSEYGNMLNPKEGVTRAEAALVIYKLLYENFDNINK